MANKLKQFRVSINETQEEMAEKWNISLSFLKKLEGGEKNPSIKTIKDFKKIYPTADISEIFLS
jgi:DNA-binding XRE family transcriptional regulator